MNKKSQINDNEKWAAVKNCSIEYDDLFLYGLPLPASFATLPVGLKLLTGKM